MAREQKVLKLLRDGDFHSGEDLARTLGITRAAVWKIIQSLTGQGVELYAVPGRGYRLAEPLELLETERIRAMLDADVRDSIRKLIIHQRIDSTNDYLMSHAKGGLPSGTVCLAEAQSAGRGRQGRSWVSPYAANIYLSVLWRFTLPALALTGLSLVTGVAVARGLQRFGVSEIQLKWPNDVLWRRRKLGGILLELSGESSGPCYVVAGVGVNVAMAKSFKSRIDQPWVDLRRVLGPGKVARNHLAAVLASEIARAFVTFESSGFSAFHEEWRELDIAMDQYVVLQLPNKTVAGHARGVDESGALLLETGAGIQHYLGGEISLKLE
jgi:BirA family biotin operon repressor/biotin-[acetyl-CoA-carboxylase] ligase